VLDVKDRGATPEQPVEVPVPVVAHHEERPFLPEHRVRPPKRPQRVRKMLDRLKAAHEREAARLEVARAEDVLPDEAADVRRRLGERGA